jgi:uncharacterized protein (TIRG00374 family)
MNQTIWDRSMLITAIGVSVISAVSVGLAWRSSANLAQPITLAALAPIICAALLSYFLRIVRFHYLLSQSKIPLPFQGTALIQMVGFAFSVTPGRVGEIFKLHLIRERAGTPVIQTAPLLLLDRLTEAGGFLILALAATLALPNLRNQIPSSSLLLIALGLICAFAAGRRLLENKINATDPRVTRFAGSLPWLRHIRNLWRGLDQSFTLTLIAGGLALSTVARFWDGLVVLLAARMIGVELTLPAAVLVLAVSGLVGGISFLPAGVGAVETTMTGLLLLLGADLPSAVTITLVARLSTLWIWVGLGLGMTFALHLTRVRPQA